VQIWTVAVLMPERDADIFGNYLEVVRVSSIDDSECFFLCCYSTAIAAAVRTAFYTDAACVWWCAADIALS